jgi:hypothetical protein
VVHHLRNEAWDAQEFGRHRTGVGIFTLRREENRATVTPHASQVDFLVDRRLAITVCA